MIIEETFISGLFIISPEIIKDSRGFFLESYKTSTFKKVVGYKYNFAQSNHSRSKANTLRGFRQESCSKLIYVTRGTALLIVVDSRIDSPTFRQYKKIILGDSPGKHQRILITKGLSNAFYCFNEVDYVNDVSEEYHLTEKKNFCWNDQSLNIDWPIEKPFLSESDSNLPSFNDLFL